MSRTTRPHPCPSLLPRPADIESHNLARSDWFAVLGAGTKSQWALHIPAHALHRLPNRHHVRRYFFFLSLTRVGFFR